jgi:signal transduction histidine kinase
VHINTRPLPAIIEHVVAGRKQTFIATEAKPGKPVLLPPGSGHRLEIHFAATSLVAADRVKFRYRLQGYDPDWSNESDLRQAFYTNLRPGRYTFQVQACNPHGIWNQDATTIPLFIAPYFWETPWFYGLVVLVAGTVLLLAHRQRLGVLRRLQELDHQQNLLGERSRIAADMHDDLGAALTQIAILGEVAKNQLNDPNRARTVLTRISESAREVTARMSDLVWATNPRNDTLDNLVAYLREHLARKLEEANIRARLVFPEDPEALHLSATFRRNILLTVKEALNNALKHANASDITVELKVEPRFLMIRLQDNGKGFDSVTGARFGNGLMNMRRRIEDLGGTLNISAVPGEGTSVRMRVPIQQRGGPRK